MARSVLQLLSPGPDGLLRGVPQTRIGVHQIPLGSADASDYPRALTACQRGISTSRVHP